MPRIILASGSPYRKELLGRLTSEFEVMLPSIDETPKPGESVQALVSRLTHEKCRVVQQAAGADRVIISSDQCAEWHGQPINKPGSYALACEQLAMLSGQTVDFHTGLAVACQETGLSTLDIVTTRVTYRHLSRQEIEAYLQAEPAWDCAGSFRCEGLGIALLARIETDDPTALVGLPLIRLVTRLREAGIALI